MSYWDTSCLIKLYTPEPDSATFHSRLEAGEKCVTCDITPLEFWATVRRKETEGVLAAGQAERIHAEFEADIASGTIVMVNCDATIQQRFHQIVEHCHTQTPPIYIRTNDALHLAAAQCAGETQIIATDKRLREAARVLGLVVFP